MGKWRDETKILLCGCRIGRSASGQWFYDFICKYHLKECRFDGKYSDEKALEMTEKLNKRMTRCKFRPDQCPNCKRNKGFWCYKMEDNPILLSGTTKDKCKDFEESKEGLSDCHL